MFMAQECSGFVVIASISLVAPEQNAVFLTCDWKSFDVDVNLQPDYSY